MKRKRKWGEPYRKLMHIIFSQVLLMAVLAFLSVIFFRSAGRGKIGNFITRIIQVMYQVDWKTATIRYVLNVRSYIEYILLGAMVVFFIIFVRLVIFWFMRYFDEIIRGINQLAEGKQEQIAMPQELAFVSEQLNKVNNELIRSAKAEREAEKRKNDLVAYLAHDIKTPLTSVIGYLSLLEESSGLTEEERSKYTRIALEKSYRLETLVSELFEIARYNLDTVPLQKERVHLRYMIDQMADEAYPLLAANGKTISAHIGEELEVYADSEKLARAFNNILKNAITYSRPSSSIRISGEKHGRDITICFENDGSIPQDRQDVIFDKFYRLDDARQTATGGAGLGLAITRDIITLHGGTIVADSADGRTIFKVVLPAGISHLNS